MKARKLILRTLADVRGKRRKRGIQ